MRPPFQFSLRSIFIAVFGAACLWGAIAAVGGFRALVFAMGVSAALTFASLVAALNRLDGDRIRLPVLALAAAILAALCLLTIVGLGATGAIEFPDTPFSKLPEDAGSPRAIDGRGL